MGLFDKLKLDKGNKDFFVWLDSLYGWIRF